MNHWIILNLFGLVRMHEYQRDGWTFHAKGEFLTLKEHIISF